jgi:hypothetical protein
MNRQAAKVESIPPHLLRCCEEVDDAEQRLENVIADFGGTKRPT